MKRAYLATVELEYIVVAETEEQAKRLAIKEFRDDSVWEEDFQLGEVRHVPWQYESDGAMVPVFGGEDIPVSEALKLPGGYKHVPARE